MRHFRQIINSMAKKFKPGPAQATKFLRALKTFSVDQ